MITATIVDKSIANYRIVELIGTGGMANIYKAIQLSLDRPVALKILHSYFNADEGFVARFEKEAKQAAILQHENIVSIIDYGHDKDEYYIAMEYVDGRNLKEILETQKRLPLEICLLLCQQVAEGLKYAHGHNLVHRDIKPANILLSSDGRVMITDFGIARGYNDLSITATGQTIGSPAYMSPEQAAGKPIDYRSDIFSLGIILYEAIAGEKPFKGDTYQGMVASIMSQEPRSLQEMRIDVTPDIEQVTSKALVKVPDHRYRTAEEFSDALSTQLAKFKIPPPRKLISGYLRNPIKVTEKLRADKIADHMEAALYSMTLGEGKLAEAKREFQDVLRFDKNNKSARKYLARLDSHPALKKKNASFFGLPQRGSLSNAIAIVAVIVMAVAAFSIQHRYKTNYPPDPVKTRATAKIPGKQAEQARILPPTRPETQPLQKIESGSVASSTKKLTTLRAGAPFSYPLQNIKAFGLLTVRSDVRARLDIDQISYGQTNGPAIKLAPGRHFVEIRADGYRRVGKRITVEKDRADILKINLERK